MAKGTVHLNIDVYNQLWDQFFHFSHLTEAQISPVTARLFEPCIQNNLVSAALACSHAI